MRFLLLFTVAWTAILAEELSADTNEDEPKPFDFGNTVTLQASNMLPSDTDSFFQDGDNVDDATIPPFNPPAGESLISNSETSDNPATDETLDNLNIDSLSAPLDAMTNTKSLEAGCVPDNPAMPGKLRKRQNLSCPPNHRMQTDPSDAGTTTDDATTDIVTKEELDKLLEEDSKWRKEHGRAAAMSGKSNECGSSGGFYRMAACCLPPPITTQRFLGSRVQESFDFAICQPYLEGRPWCAVVTRRKCCQDLLVSNAPIAIVPRTYYGENCVPMTA